MRRGINWEEGIPMGKFSTIKYGEQFYIDGEPFKKTGDLTYNDMAGFERYIGPFEDAKIVLDGASAKSAVSEMEPEWLTDPATRVQTKNPRFGKKIKKTPAKKTTKKAK